MKENKHKMHVYTLIVFMRNKQKDDHMKKVSHSLESLNILLESHYQTVI